MRSLIGIAVVWLAISVLVGWIGASTLAGWWRQQSEATLRRESEMAAVAIAAHSWEMPWESNPTWSELERNWELDIVPVYSSEVRVTDPNRGYVQDNAALERRREGSKPVRWTATRSGSWLISHVQPLANSESTSPSPVKELRITRQVKSTGLLLIWWAAWGCVTAIGLATATTGLSRLRHYLLDRRLTLSSWTQTALHSRAENASLPSVTANDNELQVQYNIIQEAVNRWLQQLQDATQRSALVLSNLQEGVLAVDHDSRVLLANDSVQRLLDFSGEQYLDRALVEVIRWPQIIQIVADVMRAGQPRDDSFERGNPPIALRVLASPLPLGKSNYGVLLTVRDETLLRRVEMSRRDFVTNASHELKTPLAAIRAYAETLQLGALDEKPAAEHFVAGILTQADRIHGLVNGMLQLARVQSGGIPLERIKFDVRSCLDACLEAAAVVAKGKHVSLISRIADEVGTMTGDPEALQTIVGNLLSNAVRYTPEGGSVSLVAKVDQQTLLLVVEDTGIGISREDQSRIFERFYRVERARTAGSGGTGLGLSIVKHLVQAFHGSIRLTSQPNVGSHFEVRLPLD